MISNLKISGRIDRSWRRVAVACNVHLPAGDAVEVAEGIVAGEPAVDGGGDVDDAALDAGRPRRLRHLLQQQPRQQEVP